MDWIFASIATIICYFTTKLNISKNKAYFFNDEDKKRVNRSLLLSFAFCLTILLSCLAINFLDVKNADGIFWVFIILITLALMVRSNAKKYFLVFNAALELIEDKKEIGYFTIDDMYYKLNDTKKQTKEKQEEAFKKFLEEQAKLSERILDGLANTNDIVVLNLNGVRSYFFYEKYNELVDKITDITTKEILPDKQNLINKLKKIASLSNEMFSDLIMLQDIETKLYNYNEVLIHPINIDEIRYCSSCGKVVLADDADDDGEWFCSDTCSQTEYECIEIAKEIHNSQDFGKTQESVSKSVAVAFSAIASSEAWNTNFRPIQTSENFLNHTKGVGTNAKGQIIDANNNVIVSTGHGDAAEIMNTKLDNISGKSATLVGGDNVKNGADRIVDGIKIQSKYCKTPSASVNSAFDGPSGNYRYMDNNGKPMQLEVPKDQYDKAVEIMANKIKKGQVPGVSDPSEAKNIIRKGNVTLAEAKNYAKFCSKESLKFDAMNGAVVAVGAFGVSLVVNTSILYFKNKDIKQALQQASISSMKAGGQTFVTYIATSQIQRIPQVNSFLQSAINFRFDSQIGKAFAGTISKPGNISATTAANNALRSTVVVAGVTMAITSSVEIFQMMKGQISGMQCLKNIAQNAGGIAGGAAGALVGAAALSFIPGVGTVVGGIAGGLIGGFGGGTLVKKIMDNFIEDDSIKKQKVFFFQMMYLAMTFKLSGDEAQEFKAKVDKIIMSSKDFFGSDFSLDLMQPYSNSILKPIIVSIVAMRPIVPNEAFKEQIIEAVVIDEIIHST
ncbi:hypothetical protein [Campylobacter sp. VTCC 70190]|uniref:hypothetical protein n=1 Tax=Campylobacter sp. VTCC 70190 TaxID=3392118 RepID=UPI00398F21B8